jgi:hypothetical protein
LVRYATVAAVIVLTAAACGGGHKEETFSAPQIIATFRADQLSIGRDRSMGCGKRLLPKQATSATKETLSREPTIGFVRSQTRLVCESARGLEKNL